jgi:hypothetical protein
VAGLRELAMAYAVSDRADKPARIATYLNGMKSVASWFIGNNTALLDMYDSGGGPIAGTFRNRGAAFDGINPNGSGIPQINRNTGGESFDEATWAMILAKAAIRDFGLDPTFTFETGASSAAPPVVTASTFDFDATMPTLRVAFSQDVGASLHAYDVRVADVQTGGPIPSESLALAYNAATRELSVTFPALAAASLPDGNYRLSLPAGTVVGNSGNPLASTYQFDFFVLAGDANRDRAVDIGDFATLAGNFNRPATFSGGDFNYNGIAEIGDFAILASRFNQALPAARLASPAPSSAAAPTAADAGRDVGGRIFNQLFYVN